MVQFGAFVVPSAEDPEATVAEIVRSEALGLDLVGVQDHPYQRRFLETFSLLAFAAARTQRIRLFRTSRTCRSASPPCWRRRRPRSTG
jgi:alkanesulfonate monooxygenase SsuD/methylene tetrahydromethanopterin reductase-like flavin-dependent oxidoreductase (luciferase family)